MPVCKDCGGKWTGCAECEEYICTRCVAYCDNCGTGPYCNDCAEKCCVEPKNYSLISPIKHLQERARKDPEVAKRLKKFVNDVIGKEDTSI